MKPEKTVLLGLCICFIIFHLRPRRPKNFPPGPPALPIVGNILHLNLQNLMEDFEKVRKISLFFYTCSPSLFSHDNEKLWSGEKINGGENS
uniref:Uncharacterized protein n=1 Tax=Acanthochromis polyacanthus TaxID=80966 RepID=A0A3Q1GFJ4_9TELE